MGRHDGGEIEVVGVKTRARAALTMAATTNSTSISPAKKIKKVYKRSSCNNCDYQLRSSDRRVPKNFAIQRDSTAAMDVEVEEEVVNCSSSEVITTTTTINSDYFSPSCCSSNENDEDDDQLSYSNGVLVDRCIADPEVENNGDASLRYIDCHTTTTEEVKDQVRVREEATKSNGQDYHSPAGKSTVQIKVMPSYSEIEEFFDTAEKHLQKRFIDKYNFDIVKDMPLEGRYEWVPIKP